MWLHAGLETPRGDTFRVGDYSGVGSRTGKNWGVRRGLSGISGDRRFSLALKEGKHFGEVLCP
jgi:hypothetical protein